ncbi:hypothetical protein G9A89_009907 [Geosiphon pyriformis]|nr:hypothetical protein G9A89_009907 [Geosiphon pyriformis]
MKKAAKKSGSGGGLRPVLPRKKRRGGVLNDIVEAKMDSTETGNMTKSKSVDIEKECLVEETSFQQKSKEEFGGGNADMTFKSPKRTVINKEYGDNDNVLNELLSLSLLLSLKPVKLNFVRKIFSGVNGFGGAFTSSKFGGIIRVTFTSNEAMIAAANLANDCGVVMNTGLKHPGNNHINWSIVLKKIPVGTSLKTVHAAVSEFGKIVKIRMQLVGLWQKAIVNLENQNQADLLAFKWSILIGKDVVCVVRADGVGLCWFRLFLALCLVCKCPDHTSLTCVSVKNDSTLKKKKALLSMHDQARLANIYAKKFAPISHPLSFNGKIWASVVGASPGVFSHQSSLISLVRQIVELAKRLDLLMLAVSQSSPGCQLPMTPPLQNQEEDIVMRADSGEAISGKIAAFKDSSVSSHVIKLENMLEGLSSLVWKIAMCNVWDMNNPAKQNNIVCWHKNMGNLILIVTKTKLKGGICLWIMDKFDGVQVFTSSLDVGHLDSGVTIIMNISLARHVYKVLDVFGRLLSIRLLFKNKLSVSILELYAEASLAYCEETYPIQSQYSIDFELETETSNKGKHKLKQYSKTTPNTSIPPKTTAKHLQTPEQETTENQSEYSETAVNKENDSETSKEESIDSENKEDNMTAYIAKIPEFNREDIETSSQKWLNQVTKAGDANGWNAAKMLRTIPYFLKETAGKWFKNLTTSFND